MSNSIPVEIEVAVCTSCGAKTTDDSQLRHFDEHFEGYECQASSDHKKFVVVARYELVSSD